MPETELLDRARFHLDDPLQFGFPDQAELSASQSILSHFATRHVQVTSSLFPRVASAVQRATGWLLGEREPHAFISADETLNAACIPGPGGLPLIWVSSGLVKCLNEVELTFVIGHELGHWHYQHFRYPSVPQDEERRFAARQALSRAAEISADRVGLIACRDIDVALAAIVKTASGLGENHLGTRLSDFVTQVRSMKVGELQEGELFASHPPMAVRARALLWFSMSNIFLGLSGEAHGASDIDSINSRVEKDLTTALGDRFSQRQEEEISDAVLWMVLYELMVDGSLSKPDQDLIRSSFGPDVLAKISAFVKDKTADSVIGEIRKRALHARALLEAYPNHQIQTLIASNSGIAEHAMRFMRRFT